MPTIKNDMPPSSSASKPQSKPTSVPQPAPREGEKAKLPDVNTSFPGTESGGPPP